MTQTFRDSLSRVTQGQKLSRLAEAAERIIGRYRATDRPEGALLGSDIDRMAYLIIRADATHAAAMAALGQAAACTRGLHPRSLLDLGAGAGSAAWAALEMFPSLEAVRLLERDTSLIDLGKQMASSGPAALRQARWDAVDFTTLAASTPGGEVFPAADLVVMNYALGELQGEVSDAVLTQAWNAARMALVIVEPGSRRGFGVIRAAREKLLAAGAVIVAPCPHQKPCPMTDPDWCHFTLRFERSQRHRQVVGGTLSYDDEKFAYLAAIKPPAASAGLSVSNATTDATAGAVTGACAGDKAGGGITAHQPESRLVKVPLRRSGHVVLDLCRDGELVRQTVSKKHGELYRAARDAQWGDGFPGAGHAGGSEPGESGRAD